MIQARRKKIFSLWLDLLGLVLTSCFNVIIIKIGDWCFLRFNQIFSTYGDLCQLPQLAEQTLDTNPGAAGSVALLNATGTFMNHNRNNVEACRARMHCETKVPVEAREV